MKDFQGFNRGDIVLIQRSLGSGESPAILGYYPEFGRVLLVDVMFDILMGDDILVIKDTSVASSIISVVLTSDESLSISSLMVIITGRIIDIMLCDSYRYTTILRDNHVIMINPTT